MDEGDGANIRVNDLICMVLQIGVLDTSLQRELGAIKNPTLVAFNNKIEGYEQTRKTTASTAFGNAASKGASQQHPPREVLLNPTPVLQLLVGGVNTTGALLCMAVAFAAQRRTIYYFRNVAILETLNAICAPRRVILHPLAVGARTSGRLSNFRLLR